MRARDEVSSGQINRTLEDLRTQLDFLKLLEKNRWSHYWLLTLTWLRSPSSANPERLKQTCPPYPSSSPISPIIHQLKYKHLRAGSVSILTEQWPLVSAPASQSLKSSTSWVPAQACPQRHQRPAYASPLDWSQGPPHRHPNPYTFCPQLFPGKSKPAHHQVRQCPWAGNSQCPS